MSRRRGSDKPVEKLRSSWTSDADLEETLAQMFHRDTVPGDKLTEAPPPGDPAKSQLAETDTAQPPDSLAPLGAVKLPAAPPAALSPGSTGNLSGEASVNLAGVPPVSLSGPLYETLEGLVVDAKCIRPFDAAPNGHTPSEQAVYAAMWRMLPASAADPDSREGLLPMRLIADKVSLSVRNLRRVLHSLMDKLAVDVTEYEDKTKSIPRRYRVWSPKLVVERRRRAGYTHIYRNRNLITIARPRVSLSGDHQTT